MLVKKKKEKKKVNPMTIPILNEIKVNSLIYMNSVTADNSVLQRCDAKHFTVVKTSYLGGK